MTKSKNNKVNTIRNDVLKRMKKEKKLKTQKEYINELKNIKEKESDYQNRSVGDWVNLRYTNKELYSSYIINGFPNYEFKNLDKIKKAGISYTWNLFTNCLRNKVYSVMVPTQSKIRLNISVGCIDPRIFDIELRRLNPKKRAAYCVRRKNIEIGEREICWKLKFIFDEDNGIPNIGGRFHVRYLKSKLKYKTKEIEIETEMKIKRLILKIDIKTFEVNADVYWESKKRVIGAEWL
jgi:hypothetical protein